MTAHSSRSRASRLRVVTYNILLGAARRETAVLGVLKRSDADVIALQEASNLDFVESVAAALGMRAYVGRPGDGSELNLAVLTRLPVRQWHNHRHPGRMLRSHLEVDLEIPWLGGERTLAVHCVHLAARFGERSNGEVRRTLEMTQVLDRIARVHDVPHIVLGDFNALAPGDSVAATAFFRRIRELRRARLMVTGADGLMGPRLGHELDVELEAAWLARGIDPRLDVGIPHLPTLVGPLTAWIPASRRLDAVLTRRLSRSTVQRMRDQGYVDCYRRMHPRARGFTCATWLPAARIDYVFASPSLSPFLSAADVIGSRTWPDRDTTMASDHFPVAVDFAS